MNQKRIATFRYEILAWLAPICYLTIPISWLGGLLAPGEGTKAAVKGFLLTSASLGGVWCTFALIYTFTCRLKVYRNGISAYDPYSERFEQDFMEWTAMQSVTERGILGVKYLVAASDSQTGRLWVPVRLKNREAFISLVRAYGGIANPLYQALQKQSPSRQGQEEDEVILADDTLDRYETDRQFKINSGAEKYVGWLGTVFFSGLALFAFMDKAYDFTLFCIPFVLLCACLIVGNGIYFIDNEHLEYKKTLGGPVRIAWQDVRKMEVRNREIVLHGDDLRFVMPPLKNWRGRDAREARALVLRKIEELNATQQAP